MLETKELKIKGSEELMKILREEREKLSLLRFKLVGSQMKEVHQIEDTKRNIARVLTLLNQKNNQ